MLKLFRELKATVCLKHYPRPTFLHMETNKRGQPSSSGKDKPKSSSKKSKTIHLDDDDDDDFGKIASTVSVVNEKTAKPLFELTCKPLKNDEGDTYFEVHQ